MAEEKGFFENLLDKGILRAQRLGKVLQTGTEAAKNTIKKQASKEIEAIKLEAERLDLSPEHIKEITDPSLKLENSKLLFKVYANALERKLFSMIKSIDTEEKFSFYDKLADKIIDDRKKIEDIYGVKYAKKVNELPYHLRDMYADVPEETKFKFIDILSHRASLKLSDLDPNMTKEQATVIAAVAPLLMKTENNYTDKDILTGNIFRDKEGKLLPAEKMLKMTNDYFQSLALMEENGQKIPVPNFKFTDWKKDIIALEKLSLEITGKPNDILKTLPLYLNDMAFDFVHKTKWLPEARRQYLDAIENDQRDLERAINDALGDKNADELTAKEISEIAESIKENNKNINFDKEYIEDFIRAVAVYGEEEFDPTIQKDFRKLNPMEKHDYKVIERKAEVYFELAQRKDNNPLEGDTYNFNGQKIEFKNNNIKITNKDKKEYTFTLDEFNKKTPEEQQKFLKDISYVAVNGLTQKESFNRAEQEKEIDKEFERQKAIERRKESHKRDSIEIKVGAEKDIAQLEEKIRKGTGMENIVVVLKKNELQVRSGYKDKDKSLKFKFREEKPELKDNNFYKDETFVDNTKMESDMEFIENLFKDFTKKYTPEKIDKALEVSASKDVQNFLNKNRLEGKVDISLDLEKLKKENPEFAKTINEVIPNAIAVRVFEGNLGIVTSNNAKNIEDRRLGMIFFDKNANFKIEGADKNLNKLKINHKEENEKINQIKSSLLKAVGNEMKSLEHAQSVNRDSSAR